MRSPKHKLKLVLAGGFFAVIALSWSSALKADELMKDSSSIFVGQITPDQQLAKRQQFIESREVRSLRSAKRLDPRVSSMLRIAKSLRQSAVIQRGRRNTAISDTRGRNNITGQIQLGQNHSSNIDIIGNSNKLVGFQRGSSARSNLDVIGNNKTVYHFQFGKTQRVKELPFRGSNQEKFLLIDQGRRGAYITRLK